jgi:hypothetical protein
LPVMMTQVTDEREEMRSSKPAAGRTAN